MKMKCDMWRHIRSNGIFSVLEMKWKKNLSFILLTQSLFKNKNGFKQISWHNLNNTKAGILNLFFSVEPKKVKIISMDP